MNDTQDEVTAECFECGEKIHAGENYYQLSNGDYICEHCYEESYITCEHCGKVLRVEDAIVAWDECLCRDCAEQVGECCEDCGEWVRHEDIIRLHNGDHICSRCFDNNGGFYCENCREAFLGEEYGGENDCGAFLCTDCWEESGGCLESYLEDGYSDTFRPRKTPADELKEKAGESLLFLGFELESGGVRTAGECLETLNSISPQNSDDDFLFKEDGSIPDFGAELVSQPGTLAWHKNFKWERILRELRAGGFKSHDLGGECGLHVHFNRSFLSESQAGLLDYFVQKNQPFFEKFARRENSRWAKFGSGMYGIQKGKYTAVNFSHEETVEIRIFRGTLKTSTLLATLELVDLLVRFCKQQSFHSLATAKNALSNFGEFCKKINARVPELYDELFSYLEERKITFNN